MAQPIQYDCRFLPVGLRSVSTNIRTLATAYAICFARYQPSILSKERQAYRSLVALIQTFVNKCIGGRS